MRKRLRKKLSKKVKFSIFDDSYKLIAAWICVCKVYKLDNSTGYIPVAIIKRNNTQTHSITLITRNGKQIKRTTLPS